LNNKLKFYPLNNILPEICEQVHRNRNGARLDRAPR